MNEALVMESAQAVEVVDAPTAQVPAATQPVESPTPADPILAAILAASRDPNTDIEKFTALKSMWDEERRYGAEVAYREAMNATQMETEPVVKDARNDQTKSNYARIEAIAKSIAPVYTKHGFSLEFDEGNTDKPNHIRVVCDVGHARGHKTQRRIDVPVDATGIAGKRNKTDTHAVASSFTYGRRLLTLMIFNIATEDDDGNAAGNGEPISKLDLMEIREMLTKLDRTEAQFLELMNTQWGTSFDGLDKLPETKALQARRFLESKLKGAANG